MSDHLKGVILVIICGALGYLWRELQHLIKDNEVHAIRIEHLEQDNKGHKQSYKDLYESLFKMVSELKDDISELKESILKKKHD